MEKDEEKIAISASQLMVNYDKTPILWDISFKSPSGILMGVIGPNGAGKSTLLKSLLGLVKPLAGHVRFFGDRLKNVGHRIAYIPQREEVDWDFPITVIDLVLMGRYRKKGLFKWMQKADREAAMHTLDIVGMLPYKDRQISKLSGGQQQRCFIARALLQEADLYLLDEPFSGVDVASEKLLMDLFKKMVQAGKTIWMVHHDLKTVSQYFDWLTVLNMSLIACGPVKEVFKEDIIARAYGKDHVILGEVGKLSREKLIGDL